MIKTFFTIICLGVISYPLAIFAQLPLLTDDTGTQGKGHFQFELSNGMDYNSEHRCNEKTTEIAPVFTYGLHNKIDVVLCTPYLFTEVDDDTITTAAHGFSDFSLEMKYTFLSRDKLSMAIKPGLLIPTGNWRKGLGCGRLSASLFLVNTLNFSRVMLHTNLGFLHNANRHGDALNIWHASLGGDVALDGRFHLVLNTGIEKNPDSDDPVMPAFALAGMYILITPDCELAAGYKTGITRPESDHSVIIGFTFRL